MTICHFIGKKLMYRSNNPKNYIIGNNATYYINNIKTKANIVNENNNIFNRLSSFIMKGKCVTIFFYTLVWDTEELIVEMNFYYKDKEEILQWIKELSINVSDSNESIPSNVFFINTILRIEKLQDQVITMDIDIVKHVTIFDKFKLLINKLL